MSYLQDQKPVTLFELGKRRAEGRKIAMLTAYDASFAALLGRAGVDSILIGDSLGNVLQGDFGSSYRYQAPVSTVIGQRTGSSATART